jgi:hypothetical protein
MKLNLKKEYLETLIKDYEKNLKQYLLVKVLLIQNKILV